ncbi:peroxisomal bifunctional enzyme isoform X1 [Electrophorus electricus]|uniref:Peroxisomal bifunctional enzyme n=2 Tax=Electrophorus electricus TaxID=8005 RepID=A0A4W4H4F1_ELEEL|nr:peroxisomal bifunctional enzyme isoform X1 [Electrophorus electricus]
MARYSRTEGTIALITLSNPPVNALGAAVRRTITDIMHRALTDGEVKAVVLCGENGTFCAGADIREFGKPPSGPALVPLIHDMEASEKPVVAAIEGVALGGGLEIALGCHYRIAHAKARLGFPEVMLGLIPGAGGSQRLPRLIGIPAALELITTGRLVSAQEALKLGIVDQVVDGNTIETAVKFALNVIGRPLLSRRLSERTPAFSVDAAAVLEEGMARVKQRARGAFAPVVCVQALRAAATLPYSRGMETEEQLINTLIDSSQARALQYCFFAQRNARKWSLPSGARWNNSKPRAVHRVGVVGLGTMGRGITVSLVKAGISVVAVEMEEKQMDLGMRAVLGMLERDAQRRGDTRPPTHLLTFTLSLQQLGNVDLVIEAVFEDMALKKCLFTELCNVCKPSTLLCTNTSGLDVDALAVVTHRRSLVVGMHFFAPANVMKLLEVVCGPHSSAEAVATAMTLGKRLGKVGVVVGNCPGFVGNRMMKLYLDQAYFLLEEGAAPEQVDQVLEEFGFTMGIFKVSDLSGLDVGWRVRKASGLIGPDVNPKTPSRWRQGCRYSPLPDLLCEQGHLGQKSGRGWYLYETPGGKEPKPDPAMHRFLQEYRSRYGLTPRHVHAHEVIERCTYAMANEGFRILEEGIAARAEDIDVIYVFGYGWPRHRGGPMFHAAQVGLATVLQRLEHYHQLHPDVPHLQPSPLLQRLVEAGSPPVHHWREHVQHLHSYL